MCYRSAKDATIAMFTQEAFALARRMQPPVIGSQRHIAIKLVQVASKCHAHGALPYAGGRFGGVSKGSVLFL